MDNILNLIARHKAISATAGLIIIWIIAMTIVHFRDSSWCDEEVKFRGDTSAGYYVYKEGTSDRFETYEKALSNCVDNRARYREYYGY